MGTIRNLFSTGHCRVTGLGVRNRSRKTVTLYEDFSGGRCIRETRLEMNGREKVVSNVNF